MTFDNKDLREMQEHTSTVEHGSVLLGQSCVQIPARLLAGSATPVSYLPGLNFSSWEHLVSDICGAHRGAGLN